MARTKKKPRSSFEPNWSAILWFLLAANVICGLAWSPITAANRVRVLGSQPDDESRIRIHLQSLRGVPCLRSNRRQIESLIQALDQVDTASFSQNLFGRGILKVERRQPVARLDTDRAMLLSSRGDLYTEPRPRPPVTIRLNGLAKGPNLSFASAWEPAQVADLSNNIPKMLPNSGWTVEVDGVGVLSLSRASGARIVLGSVDEMDAKLARLNKALTDAPGILDRVSRIDLTSPRSPVFVPRS